MTFAILLMTQVYGISLPQAMRPSFSSTQIKKIFAFLAIGFLAILINPIVSIDIGILLVLAVIIGHVLLREKMLLGFLVVRPALDAWRDYVIFSSGTKEINLNAAIAILFLLWSLVILWQTRTSLRKVPAISVLTTLIALAFFSSLYSLSSTTSFIEAMKLMDVGLFFVLTYIFVKKKKILLSELLTAITFSAIIPLLVGLFQLITGEGVTTFQVRNRIYGTFAHPNVFAFFTLFILILFTQYGILHPTEFWKKNKALRFPVLLFLVALILFTYTRAAWVGLFFFVCIIGVLNYRRALLGFLVGSGLLYIVLFPLNSFISDLIGYNLQQIPLISRITTRDEEADSIEWRQQLLNDSLPIIGQHPILGYGYGTFPVIWEAQRPVTNVLDDSAEAHNDYLRIAVELGFLGFMLYGFFLVTILRFAVSSYKQPWGKQPEYAFFVAWVAVFAIISFSDNMLHHTPVMWFMWAWWGAVFALHYKEPEGNLLD